MSDFRSARRDDGTETEKGAVDSGFGHGGNIHRLARERPPGSKALLDFSANINPLGPPTWLRALVNRRLSMLVHYPDPDCHDLVAAIGKRYRVPTSWVIPANGTTELLYLLPRLLQPRPVVLPVPSYIDYYQVFARNGFPIRFWQLDEANGFAVDIDRLGESLRGGELVLFGNPANPAGSLAPDAAILALAERCPGTLFIIDEAFHDFTADFQTVGGRLDNLLTLNSLTKFFALPGLRIGFGLFPPAIAADLSSEMPPWSVNALAQEVAVRALDDDDYCRQSRLYCREQRREFQQRLAALPAVTVYDSAANYVLLKLQGSVDGELLYQRLLENGFVIRRCGNYRGLDQRFVRVAVRNRAENDRLAEAMAGALAVRPTSVQRRKRRVRTLMFQGTSSNAGKSILTAAFCRMFLQDGFSVAPFKAQNMSLNSFVTRDGGEMGRAQVVQALAARVEPDWRMNPVLLKPNSDTGSQVIVNGRPVGSMNVRQYHAYKEQAWAAARQSFAELAEQFSIIVLEGAGSPGEINLRRHDFVNMKMAQEAQAPVLLVGDIDRGGVYASFAGTMDVLDQWERACIAGFVVNKFRGDQSLLDEAHRFIVDHTGREVFAVVPYIADLAIPQEDSVSLRDGWYGCQSTGEDEVEIVVIDLPHISNFTDIDALHAESDVNIRFVSRKSDLGRPDAVILPGSKNVAGDLAFLRQAGLLDAVRDYAASNGMIVGICGGYQMLGESVRDPHHLETDWDEVPGLGLLAVSSELYPEKVLRRSEGIHLASGYPVAGYEIHHGITDGGVEPVLSFADGRRCGGRNHDGRIWGAYLHGIFDADGFRRWFVDGLRRKKGLSGTGVEGVTFDLERQLDALADTVRSCFAMDRIYRLLDQ